jgi:N-acetyl-anhydromuramyl-L-alanine amidase AmpD
MHMCTLGVLLSTVAGADASREDRKAEPRRAEIVVCGKRYPTSAPVVLWTDPAGYDAYRLEPRFAPAREALKKKEGAEPRPHYAERRGLSAEDAEKVRTAGWDLPMLQKVVDQFVIHFDAAGTSRTCFEVLERRGLSVHFLLDLDGTIYQTLDLKESAWHATIANSRSIGIEIANIGTVSGARSDRLDRWYKHDPEGRVRITIPEANDPEGRLKNRVERPARDEPVVGTIQGQSLRQYDLTPEQYESLIRLTATLCTLFPRITLDYPRDASGALIPHKLPDADYQRYQGILGHYHVQTNKVDPGPAFQWNRLIDGARKLNAQ